MTLKHSLSFIFAWLLPLSQLGRRVTSFQTPSSDFATRAEGQMLITELDDYTRDWNQFDIDVRLPKTARTQITAVAVCHGTDTQLE